MHIQDDPHFLEGGNAEGLGAIVYCLEEEKVKVSVLGEWLDFMGDEIYDDELEYVEKLRERWS